MGCHPLNKIINQLLCIIVCQSPVPPMSHFTVISLSHEIFFKERHCENQPLKVSLLRKSLTLFFHTASFFTKYLKDEELQCETVELQNTKQCIKVSLGLNLKSNKMVQRESSHPLVTLKLLSFA